MIKSATLIGCLLGSAMAVSVFIVKYEVQDLEAEFTQLNNSIADERQAIHVLLAEWSHLNEPARLRELARQHLNLDAISARQMGGLNAIPRREQSDNAYPHSAPDDLKLIQAAIREMSAARNTQ